MAVKVVFYLIVVFGSGYCLVIMRIGMDQIGSASLTRPWLAALALTLTATTHTPRLFLCLCSTVVLGVLGPNINIICTHSERLEKVAVVRRLPQISEQGAQTWIDGR